MSKVPPLPIRKTIQVILLLGVVTLILLAVVGAGFWYPGFTQRQTANILLNDDKFSDRASRKAAWHGVPFMHVLADQTKGFSDFSYSGARNTMFYLDEVVSPDSEIDYELFDPAGRHYARLFRLYVEAKQGKELTNTDKFYLVAMVDRKHPDIKPEYLFVTDFFTELAMMTLATARSELATETIIRVRKRDIAAHTDFIAREALLRAADQGDRQ